MLLARCLITVRIYAVEGVETRIQNCARVSRCFMMFQARGKYIFVYMSITLSVKQVCSCTIALAEDEHMDSLNYEQIQMSIECRVAVPAGSIRWVCA